MIGLLCAGALLVLAEAAEPEGSRIAKREARVLA